MTPIVALQVTVRMTPDSWDAMACAATLFATTAALAAVAWLNRHYGSRGGAQ